MNNKLLASSNAKLKLIQNRLLIPLFIVLLLLVGAFSMVIITVQHDKLNEFSTHVLEESSNSLSRLFNKQSRALSAIQIVMLKDTGLKKALKRRDREYLLTEYEPLFKQVRDKHNITHFYFHDPDRINLLRVHNPAKHGDLINRHTAIGAEQTGEIAYGVELGPLGTFTLRVVQPVFEGDTLIGYLELGKEIEDVLLEINQRFGVELIVSIHKHDLVRENWETGMTILNRKGDWNRFSEEVLIYSTLSSFPDEILQSMSAKVKTDITELTERKFNNKIFQVMQKPMDDISGARVGYMIILHDITATKTAQSRLMANVIAGALLLLSILFIFVFIILKQADSFILLQQKELLSANSNMKSILSATPEPIVIYGIKKEPEYLNSAFTDVFGWTLEEFKTSDIPFIPNDQKQITAEKMKRVSALDDKIQFETKRLTKDNNSLDVIISVSRIKDLKSEASRLILNFIDITENKKMQKEILKAHKLESIGTLVAGITHDFNNLLFMVMGNISLAQNDLNLETEISKNLKEAEEACVKVKNLIARLITFSKGGDPIKKISSINDLLKDVVISALQNSNVQPVFFITDAVRQVSIDENQIRHAISNLIINAKEAMKNNGQLKVSCENIDITKEGFLTLNQGEYIKISFEDPGCGISKENLEQIFDPYFSTKVRGSDKGQGLGLSVSYSIIDK
ncbi:MAG: PAS domain S-box protein, partial [Desulfobacteraceae bacterium]|nr:PAS domain S-box protein [Desulfobacteraceae bacterium]